MKTRILLATVPSNEPSLAGVDIALAEMESAALESMILRRLGAPPSTVDFEILNITIQSVAARPILISQTATLALCYPTHDSEAVEYATEVLAALEEIDRWDDEALDELGEEYENNLALHTTRRTNPVHIPVLKLA